MNSRLSALAQYSASWPSATRRVSVRVKVRFRPSRGCRAGKAAAVGTVRFPPHDQVLVVGDRPDLDGEGQVGDEAWMPLIHPFSASRPGTRRFRSRSAAPIPGAHQNRTICSRSTCSSSDHQPRLSIPRSRAPLGVTLWLDAATTSSAAVARCRPGRAGAGNGLLITVDPGGGAGRARRVGSRTGRGRRGWPPAGHRPGHRGVVALLPRVVSRAGHRRGGGRGRRRRACGPLCSRVGALAWLDGQGINPA